MILRRQFRCFPIMNIRYSLLNIFQCILLCLFSGFSIDIETLHIIYNLQVIAIASREESRAVAFSEKFRIPKAYGSYLELAQDPDVGKQPSYPFNGILVSTVIFATHLILKYYNKIVNYKLNLFFRNSIHWSNSSCSL